MVIGIANNAQCWVIKEKGPVFQASMMPLNLVATIIGSQLFLAEGIYLGRYLSIYFKFLSRIYVNSKLC